MVATASLTPARRAVGGALLFLGSATLAGMHLTGDDTQYRVFGFLEGAFALLLTYTLTLRRVWPSPENALAWVPVVYGTLATAQLLDLLFPPPGVVEWVVVTGVAVHAWGTIGVRSRQRLVMRLATLTVLLALLRFSVIPILWGREEPTTGGVLGLGNPLEGVRRWFVAYEPIGPTGQLVGFVALCLWVLATRLLWPPGEERPARAALVLPPRDRPRLAPPE